MRGAGPALPGLAFPAGHAHEMLFGFGLAAVAGNQLGPLPRATLGLLFGTWLVARVAFLAGPHSVAAMLANAAFAALLALQLAPRLAGRVRKWRNRALPAAVAALCAAAIAMQAALRLGSGGAQSVVLLGGVLVMALLMLFMGGRIIAPTAAGHFHKQGIDLAVRVQPRLEGTLILVMLGALAAFASGMPRIAGGALAVAAAVGAVRLARWRPWSLAGRRDVACLTIGYAWLVAGLAAIAAALVANVRPVTAIHVVTVGAMGTLVVNVMSLTWARLARRDPAQLALPSWATAAIAVATVARAAADVHPAQANAWFGLAAAAWAAAFVLLLACFVRISRARRDRA